MSYLNNQCYFLINLTQKIFRFKMKKSFLFIILLIYLSIKFINGKIIDENDGNNF